MVDRLVTALLPIIILPIITLTVACYGQEYTELMRAARYGDTESVSRILARGADVSDRTKHGKTALMLAANHGHPATVATLISHGADKNTLDINGTTPLIAATTAHHTSTIVVLMDRGADINIRDTNGGSALINAVFFGYQDSVAVLLKHKNKIPGKDLEEALMLAAGLGYSGIVKDILKQGVNVNTKTPKIGTALIAAITFKRADTIQVLINRGADINMPGANGELPLTLASHIGDEKIIKILNQASISKTAKKNIKTKTRKKKAKTRKKKTKTKAKVGKKIIKTKAKKKKVKAKTKKKKAKVKKVKTKVEQQKPEVKIKQ